MKSWRIIVSLALGLFPAACLPSTPEPTQPTCRGSTSQELTDQMWEAYLQGDYEKALVCTSELERRWNLEAREQQAKKAQADCDYTPDPSNEAEVESFWEDYWALNDVAVGVFVRGEILREQGQCAEARAAYKVVVDEYPCAYALDETGQAFWRVADAAQIGYDGDCP